VFTTFGGTGREPLHEGSPGHGRRRRPAYAPLRRGMLEVAVHRLLSYSPSDLSTDAIPSKGGRSLVPPLGDDPNKIGSRPLLKLTVCAFGVVAIVLALEASRVAAAEAAQSANVEALEWEGVSQVSRKQLAAAIVTQAPGWLPWTAAVAFDQSTLDEDMERVTKFYRERGFFEAAPSYRLDWNDERSKVRIHIRVEEGRAVVLEHVEIEQLPGRQVAAAAWRRLTDALPFRLGRPFGVADYRAARAQLMRGLAEQGRPAPALEGGAEIDVATRTARVVWKVDPGPSVSFGEIEIDGLERFAEDIVRRELAFAPGDPYSLSAQRTSQERLIELGLFRAVTIEPALSTSGDVTPGQAGGERPEAERWPMRVRVQERPPRTLRVGVGYGTEEFIRARISWRHRNFFGGARQLDVRAQYNSLTSGLDLHFTQPHFLDPEQHLEANGSIRYETVPAYDALRTALGFMVFRELDPAWVVRGGHEFELANVYKDRENRPGGEGESRVSSLRLGISRKQLDDLASPTRGTSFDLSLDSALRAIGSSANHLTFRSEVRGFLPLWWTSVLAARFRIGAVQPVLGSTNENVPVYKRLYAGGSTSVRGFKFQKLGPLDADGNPLGGLSSAEASVELRFPIWRQLRGVAFFDAGLVDEHPFRYPIHEIQTSAGPGLRLATPIGSLRLDVGFPIDRNPDQDVYRIHLSVGQFF
jgi:outer membrane protein assembly complex protein YaeT